MNKNIITPLILDPDTAPISIYLFLKRTKLLSARKSRFLLWLLISKALIFTVK